MRRRRFCDADLAPLALELAVWGRRDRELAGSTRHPAATLASARDLLRRLGALDDAGRATAHGRAMHALGLHPRSCIGLASAAQQLITIRAMVYPPL